MCNVESCVNPIAIKSRGLCWGHYHRWRKTGDVQADVPIRKRKVKRETKEQAEARFWSKVDRGPGCWEWTDVPTGPGYGLFHTNTEAHYAHRYAYELARGPIPTDEEAGFRVTIDHLCRNRICVRPDHLQVVSHRVNTLRGESPAAKHARKTHCIHGHPFDDENTYIRPDTGTRQCKACCRDRQRAAG